MKRLLRLMTTASLLLLVMTGFWGCENDTSNGDVAVTDPGGGGGGGVTSEMTCMTCHGDKDMLIANVDAQEKGSEVGVPNKGDG
jgi:hypothetical protein